MKTYQNEHLTVHLECSVHLLQQTWVGLPTSESFRDGAMISMALARRHQIKRWLIDMRQLRLFNPMDLHWFIQHWLPQATIRLTNDARIALLLNDLGQFSKVGSDLIIRASTQLNTELACRYFVDDPSSRYWLLEKER